MNYKGNPDLEPEKSWTAETGIDLFYDYLTASVGYFYTHFRDKIEMKSDFMSGVVTWENTGRARLEGIEANLSLDIGKIINLKYRIKPYGNIVYILTRKDEDTEETLKYVEKISANWGIYIGSQKDFSIDWNFAYHGNQWIDDWESGWPAPVIKKGGFVISNLTISKKVLNLNKLGAISLRGEIRNLFNKDYSYVKGYPMPGRSIYVGIKYEY
jgi:vitamin B12 transporter